MTKPKQLQQSASRKPKRFIFRGLLSVALILVSYVAFFVLKKLYVTATYPHNPIDISSLQISTPKLDSDNTWRLLSELGSEIADFPDTNQSPIVIKKDNKQEITLASYLEQHQEIIEKYQKLTKTEAFNIDSQHDHSRNNRRFPDLNLPASLESDIPEDMVTWDIGKLTTLLTIRGIHEIEEGRIDSGSSSIKKSLELISFLIDKPTPVSYGTSQHYFLKNMNLLNKYLDKSIWFPIVSKHMPTPNAWKKSLKEAFWVKLCGYQQITLNLEEYYDDNFLKLQSALLFLTSHKDIKKLYSCHFTHLTAKIEQGIIQYQSFHETCKPDFYTKAINKGGYNFISLIDPDFNLMFENAAFTVAITHALEIYSEISTSPHQLSPEAAAIKLGLRSPFDGKPYTVDRKGRLVIDITLSPFDVFAAKVNPELAHRKYDFYFASEILTPNYIYPEPSSIPNEKPSF